jgi:uncharacterized membrane protein YecN with MAPEG domain
VTEISDDSFTHILVNDVRDAEKRLQENDTPGNRRDLVRAAFAAIEGLHWQLKRDVLKNGLGKLTAHEYAAMAEESYSVDDRGNVSSIPRFLPITTAIRLVVQVVQRYRPSYKVDFSHAGWSNLKSAVEVRNRLVHPKTLEDLAVTDSEIRKTISGFCWVLALVIEVLRETHAAVVGYYPQPADEAK